MTKKRESRRQRRIREKLEAMGFYFYKIHGNEFQVSGIPDLIGSINGLFCGFEVKEPDGEVSEDQLEEIRRIKASGGCAGVVETFEECIELVEQAGGSTARRAQIRGRAPAKRRRRRII